MARLMASGDTALVVEFGETIDREINARVLALTDRIAAARIPGVVEMVPTFRSLMVHYDPNMLLYGELAAEVERLMQDLGTATYEARLWTIPTCYGGAHGPDLEDVARLTGLTTGEVVRLHAQETYHVYCIGFLPGWAYLGETVKELDLPRRQSPRVKVPMGTVCTAQRMTGVYPIECPGGWHLLGRTPVRMFDMRRESAVLLAAGDKVRFAPITPADYDRLDALATAGTLEISSEAFTA